ncbi:Beta-secretase 2 [Phytophthora nicotianae]|uniref:Beta-secretase 2 n=1 Tax=Phytophthora nicotianae TaxID=4792 RepID=A0A0W8DQ83_PHYNI|nr:Beta-secretase 2 [Phytophthora nicotianae]
MEQLRESDILCAKAEYIERIREQLDKEECGPLSFTPTINPKSREIATNRLAEREAELQDAKHLKVTDRLANDADEIAERKLATQEYFDMLNEQPFAPQISETSRKIVEQKPEFKMNFVARQEYFQYRDQEKMEALEGFCEMEDTRGEKLTFKPDIGNADGVLKHLRPDRCSESSQQKLYRLTYNDQREAELKKQRLQEEQYAQYTFKPEINPVSKALGRSSTLDELSHPVIDIQPDPPGSKCSPPQERRNGNDISTRVALRSYFANKRFRSRVALEMEEASKAECTFQPTLVASKQRDGCASTSKLHNREPRSRTKLEWQSENLLHLIEAERQKKADEIEAKRNAQELKELEECTFKPNLHKPRTRGKPSANGSPSPPRGTVAEEVNVQLYEFLIFFFLLTL